MQHTHETRKLLKEIRKNLSEGLFFAAEAKTQMLLDTIREMPDVSKFRKHERPKEYKFDYLTSTPDA